MEFFSYQMVSDNTASLNTGSYLNRTEYSMFNRGFTTDIWYGFSAKDVIELGVWDRDSNFIGWNVFNQSKSYNEITLSFVNALNFPTTYSYSDLLTDFILYRNEKVLVSPVEQLSASFNITQGSYFLTYNFTRQMAGDNTYPLVIQDISPSRQEIKLTPLNQSDLSYEAFCRKKVLVRDVSPLYLQATKNCPVGQVYSAVSPYFQNEINTIKTVFFLNTDGAMVDFLRNLYDDYIIYSSTNVNRNTEVLRNIESLIKIQGIKTYFSNFLLSNTDKIADFNEIDENFNVFVSASIERKFAPIGIHPSKQYVDAKTFVYNFFTTYFYQPISNLLSQTYHEKYYSYFKNALNFGNNNLFTILDHSLIDNRKNLSDPLTLIVKLKDPLPNDFSLQSTCWVSNISLSPYVVNAIVQTPSEYIVHKIGAPNFSIPIPNASLTNVNKSYSAADLQHSDVDEREITVSKNLTELSVDYTDFSNFVVFSSAEMRLKIFKNKMITLSSYSASMALLDAQNSAYISASGSLYPYYTSEYTSIQTQTTDVVNTFDGYESYLYRSGSYQYVNGAFISASYVSDQDTLAVEYDKTNYDSLINNCPQHILVDSNNDDYIVFLAMIGHFFDEIYLYIANMPSEKKIGHSATEEFTRRVVDYMLETFGWTLSDSLEQSNLLNNYLTLDQVDDLNSMSAEDRLKTVRNRLLINLPYIFKTKGTEEAVRVVLACYGIPSVLLSIREYGGVNYSNEVSTYTQYERVYMRQWDTSSKYDYYRIGLPSETKTILLKTCIDDSSPYQYEQDHILIGSVKSLTWDSWFEAWEINTGLHWEELDMLPPSTVSSSGEWAIGFVRERAENAGRFFFRIGYLGHEYFKLYSPIVPLFDGNVYSIMVRRNNPDSGFEFTTDIDAVPCSYDLVVQRNDSGNRVLRATASGLVYNPDANHKFNGYFSNLMIGGWFTDFNGQGFQGAMDKLQLWFDPLSNANFEDYVNNINDYAYNTNRPAHESLMFRMHTDYPFDMRQIPANTSLTSSEYGLIYTDTNWLGFWRNANQFYASASSLKLGEYLGQYGSPGTDYMLNRYPWGGYQTLVYNTASCRYESQSAYPYQFKVIDYPCTYTTPKYGPNKFRNEKAKHVTQSVQARFDSDGRSTYVPLNTTSPDSNQVGFFVDPQDFKNKDIYRYFGNYDLMDSIGDPKNRFSESYDSLTTLRHQYTEGTNQYSGSRTLFTELMTLYKLYFNRTIFESIKNLVPARTNTLTGVLIEPTLLERPKYAAKEVFTEANTGSVFYADITASRYFRDPNTKLVRLSMSLEWTEFGAWNTASGENITGFDTSSLPHNRYIDLNMSYSALPSRTYPVNYGGNVIGDIGDRYQLGHFVGDIFSDEIPPPYVPPLIPPLSITCSINNGTIGVSYVSSFQANGGTPPYIFSYGGSLPTGLSLNTSTGVITGTPTVIGTYGYQAQVRDSLPGAPYEATSSCNIIIAAVPIIPIPPIVSVPCGGARSFDGGQTFPSSFNVDLGTRTGTVYLTFNTYAIPDKIQVFWPNTDLTPKIDTGYRGATIHQSTLDHELVVNRGLSAELIKGAGQGTATFNKTGADRYALVKVWGPLAGTLWTLTLACPVQAVDKFGNPI